MASRKHKLSPRETAFWREAVAAAAKGAAHPRQRSAARAAQYCMDFADLVVEGYRQRVLWKLQP